MWSAIIETIVSTEDVIQASIELGKNEGYIVSESAQQP